MQFTERKSVHAIENKKDILVGIERSITLNLGSGTGNQLDIVKFVCKITHQGFY